MGMSTLTYRYVLEMMFKDFKQMLLVPVLGKWFALYLFAWSTFILKKKVIGRILQSLQRTEGS